MNAALLEHIEAECNNTRLCAGDLADNILEIIRASRGIAGARPVPICASCVDLRGRLVTIYHQTLNYQDAPTALLAIRAASGPGAPAPELQP